MRTCNIRLRPPVRGTCAPNGRPVGVKVVTTPHRRVGQTHSAGSAIASSLASPASHLWTFTPAPDQSFLRVTLRNIDSLVESPALLILILPFVKYKVRDQAIWLSALALPQNCCAVLHLEPILLRLSLFSQRASIKYKTLPRIASSFSPSAILRNPGSSLDISRRSNHVMSTASVSGSGDDARARKQQPMLARHRSKEQQMSHPTEEQRMGRAGGWFPLGYKDGFSQWVFSHTYATFKQTLT